jgi:RNA polymerase sigma-70 factor (ECF subfamily)
MQHPVSAMSPIHRTPCPGEASLISKASAGDLEAFNQLVLAYQDAVYNQACVLLSDHHLAEDAVQESFIKAYRGIDKFRGGSLFAWLLKIVTNTSFDMLRQSRRQRTIPLSPEDSSEEEIESPAWLADPAPSVQAAVEQKELTGDI